MEPKEFGLARFHCVSPNLCLEVLHPASGLNTPDLSGQATVKPLAWLRPCPCETPALNRGVLNLDLVSVVQSSVFDKHRLQLLIAGLCGVNFLVHSGNHLFCNIFCQGNITQLDSGVVAIFQRPANDLLYGIGNFGVIVFRIN